VRGRSRRPGAVRSAFLRFRALRRGAAHARAHRLPRRCGQGCPVLMSPGMHPSRRERRQDAGVIALTRLARRTRTAYRRGLGDVSRSVSCRPQTSMGTTLRAAGNRPNSVNGPEETVCWRGAPPHRISISTATYPKADAPEMLALLGLISHLGPAGVRRPARHRWWDLVNPTICCRQSRSSQEMPTVPGWGRAARCADAGSRAQLDAPAFYPDLREGPMTPPRVPASRRYLAALLHRVLSAT